MVTPYRIYQLRVRNEEMCNYTYVIFNELNHKAVIIDPAWELGKIIELLNNLKVDLVAILLTHSHYDHTNLVEELTELYNLQVYMSSVEIKRYQFNCRNINPIEDFETLSIGGIKITCLLTPGHTEGGMCYLVGDSLFTGDTIFIEGCGVCDSDGGNPEKMYESIQRIKRIIPTNIRIYPGHSFGKSPGLQLDNLMKENIYFLIEDRKVFVDFRMRKNSIRKFDFK
ncbi:MBL fold metallo-hydrolase [Bacillus wiedmannii]|uniref:MBL fold metallo-hydrolase n=1 Tax=Bacillus wiedmannii TaxID=1890302 RepID=UPI000BEF8ED4|nr:MBL fold metallo-hydrolase [Bacillus wiedmannii]PEM85119.1 MBL fold metallo-hydrolase [Bacillus wiedmannii]PEO82733.1 MBL fold metallo-hydrolase [Bacillus wiedmannii]